MKKLVLVLALAVALGGLTGQAQAAETDTITVTVSLASIVSVAITPSATPWAIGNIVLAGTDNSPTYTATNNGNVTVDFNIQADDSGANGWSIGTVGLVNVFQVVETNLALTLTTSPQTLLATVTPTSTATIDMTYTAPTTDSVGGGSSHGFDIVVTASVP